jgi:hypothetical protein
MMGRICPVASPRGLNTGAGALRALLGLLLLTIAGAATAQAREGDTQTMVFIGTTSVSIEDAHSDGTTLGVRWGYEFKDDLLWTIGGAYTGTDGQKDVAGASNDIHANYTTLQTGLLYYFGRAPNKLVVPFVGGGIAAVNYDVDYRYPGSKVGKTNGTGPGGFVFAGIELWLARAITLIVSYEEDVYQIDRQGGGSSQLDSGGVILAIRLNLYSD